MDKYYFLTEPNEEVWMSKAKWLESYGSTLKNIDALVEKLTVDKNNLPIIDILKKHKNIKEPTLFLNSVFEDLSLVLVSKKLKKEFKNRLLLEAFNADDVACLEEFIFKMDYKFRVKPSDCSVFVRGALKNKSYASFRYITSFSAIEKPFKTSGFNNEFLVQAIKDRDSHLVIYLLEGKINKGYVNSVSKGRNTVFKTLENNFNIEIMDILYPHIREPYKFYSYLIESKKFEYNNVKSYIDNKLLCEKINDADVNNKRFKI